MTGRLLYNPLVSDAERQCTGMSAFAERRWIRVSVSCQSISDIKRAAGTHLVSALTADPSISLWFSIVGRYGRVTARPVGWERPAYGRGHRHQASIYRIPHSGLHTVRCSAFCKILSFCWTKISFLKHGDRTISTDARGRSISQALSSRRSGSRNSCRCRCAENYSTIEYSDNSNWPSSCFQHSDHGSFHSVGENEQRATLLQLFQQYYQQELFVSKIVTKNFKFSSHEDMKLFPSAHFSDIFASFVSYPYCSTNVRLGACLLLSQQMKLRGLKTNFESFCKRFEFHKMCHSFATGVGKKSLTENKFLWKVCNPDLKHNISILRKNC